MNQRISIRNLQIITALESISFGLHYHYNFVYIQMLGGSFISEGFLVTCLTVAELLSSYVTQIFTRSRGKKCALMVILTIAFFSHLITIMSNKLWMFMIARFIFSLTHQTKQLCYKFLLGKETNLKIRETLSINLSVLHGSGFVFGPVIGAYLLTKSPHYSDESEVPCEHIASDESLMRTIRSKVPEIFQQLQDSDLKLNWDLLLLKFLFVASITEFFVQFKHILTRNYELLSIIAKDCTVAYMNSIVFISSWYLDILKIRSKYSIEWTFCLIALLSLLLCYAPSYKFFMLLLIPFVLLKTLNMNLLKDLISQRKNEALEQIQPLAAIAANLTTPILFGVVCNSVGTVAVIPFTCVPLVVCWLVTRLYTKKFNYKNMEEGGHYSHGSHSKAE
ncbi:uncharacterized protein [Euwallacea fornicatus]|uniref:uncharacterized protein isoform X2 n=1 Tax=Euwallacea fornicatus TaxID=995702 RepID=UPI0033900E74